MKNLSRYSLLAALTLGTAPFIFAAKPKKSASAKEVKHVYKEVHSEEEFSTEVAKSGTTVVKFHAPWCSFCKKMEPEFDKAAEMLKGDANFISVNTDSPELKDIARTFKVSGLPTTLIITRKTGFMTAAELEKEVSKATGKAYGTKTTAVAAPAEAPAAPAKAPSKKAAKKS